MGAWPVLLACLIGPLSGYLGLLPVYADHKNILSAATSLYGVAIAAALFSYRPAVRRARRKDPAVWRWAPLVLLAASAVCLFLYLETVQRSIVEKREEIRGFVPAEQLRSEEILARTDWTNIPSGMQLTAIYLTVFFCAETALVLLALREYGRASASGKSRE
jgi:hypothetical protein